MIFGPPVTNAQTIARRIAENIGLKVPLREDRRGFTSRNGAWTRAILEVLDGLGAEFQCSSRHELAEGGTEKLYDLIWLGPHGKVLRLAAEIEWKQAPDEIAYDFEKLLYAKAPIKLLVHQRQDERTILPLLESTLAGYWGHVEGEEYIVIQLSDRIDRVGQRRLIAWSFCVPPTSDGKLAEKDVEFRRVAGSPFLWTFPMQLRPAPGCPS
jgi:hypothetical protein